MFVPAPATSFDPRATDLDKSLYSFQRPMTFRDHHEDDSFGATDDLLRAEANPEQTATSMNPINTTKSQPTPSINIEVNPEEEHLNEVQYTTQAA